MASNITDLYILTSEVHSKIYDKNNQNKLLGYFIKIPGKDNEAFYVQKNWVYNDENFSNCLKVGISQNLYPVFNIENLNLMIKLVHGSEIITGFINKVNKRTNDNCQSIGITNNEIDMEKLLENLNHIDDPNYWKDGIYLGADKEADFSK